MGNHKELLEKQGVYEKLYQTQYEQKFMSFGKNINYVKVKLKEN